MLVNAREAVAANEGRLGELYRRHAPGAARLAYLLTGNSAQAEDLVHEAFLKLLGRFRDLRNPDAFEWYLRRTVVNLANSHFRHTGVERAYLQREGPKLGTSPGPDLDSREDMWRRLLQLPERQRAAIVLRFYEDLTEAQVADLMRCPVGTVKSLVARGLQRLRARMSSEG